MASLCLRTDIAFGKRVMRCYLHLTPDLIGKSIDALEKHSYTTTVRAAFCSDRYIKNKINVWY